MRILLIDDWYLAPREADILTQLCGATVQVAATVAEARWHLGFGSAAVPLPDVALFDHLLDDPRITGSQLADELRRTTPGLHTIRISLSGSASSVVLRNVPDPDNLFARIVRRPIAPRRLATIILDTCARRSDVSSLL